MISDSSNFNMFPGFSTVAGCLFEACLKCLMSSDRSMKIMKQV